MAFEGFDPHAVEPQLWDSKLSSSSRDFRCICPPFVAYLKEDLQNDIDSGLVQCYVLLHGKKIAAYACIQSDRLLIEAPGGGKLSLEDGLFRSLPAIKLTTLAADQRVRGAGHRLLQWLLIHIVTDLLPQVGARLLTLNAFTQVKGPKGKPYDSSTFYYSKFRFRYVDPDDANYVANGFRSMYLDLLPMRRELQKARE